MSTRTGSFISLAKVKRGVELASSPAGDQYFLVTSKGSEKIPLEVACRLYQEAKRKGQLLWTKPKRQKKAKESDPFAVTTDPQASSKPWRDELREKLQFNPDPK